MSRYKGKPLSAWTKKAIIQEAKDWAHKAGCQWRPAIQRMNKDWLVENLLTPTGVHTARASQAKILMYVYVNHEPDYVLSASGLRRVLNPNFRIPGTDANGKRLSKEEMARLKRRQKRIEKAKARARYREKRHRQLQGNSKG